MSEEFVVNKIIGLLVIGTRMRWELQETKAVLARCIVGAKNRCIRFHASRADFPSYISL